MSERKQPEIWVVVCQNDKPHPRLGTDPGGPLVYETPTRTATRDQAMKRAAAMERYGACRIARLVFEDQPVTTTTEGTKA
jgi:hypothetical protein